MKLSINKSRTAVYTLILSTILLVFFLFGLPSLAQAEGNGTPNIPVVVVSAYSTVDVTPDQAQISMAVVKTNPNLSKAMELNNRHTEQALAALKNAGISADDIKTSNFSVYPQYDYSETGQNNIIGYQVTNEISVLVRDLNKLGKILDTALNSGANNLNYINFQKSDTSAAENQALIQAVKRAREKALVLSNASGMNLGRLLSITEGCSQPVTYGNMVYAGKEAMGGAGAVPINPGELQIKASVTIIYEMN